MKRILITAASLALVTLAPLAMATTPRQPSRTR